MAQNDWEALYGQLERATASWSRDELVALLRDLIREYVVERGLPTGTPAQASTPDLTQMDFPSLMLWLKRHLELPELALFSVDGRRVIVEADGPRELRAGRAAYGESAPAPAPAARPASSAGAPPPSRTTAAAPPPPPPAAAPEPAPDASAAPAEPPRKLSRGFRGLEFD